MILKRMFASRRRSGWVLRNRFTSAVLGLLAGCLVAQFPGCGLVSGLLGDCFGPGNLTQSEYDDLNFVAQLGYEENSCGGYSPRGDTLGELFSDLLD